MGENFDTSYEWGIEAVEDSKWEDIIDTDYADSISEFSDSDLRDALNQTRSNGRFTRVVLIRRRDDYAEGTVEMTHAYATVAWRLETHFTECGAQRTKVPQKFMQEFNRRMEGLK